MNEAQELLTLCRGIADHGEEGNGLMAEMGGPEGQLLRDAAKQVRAEMAVKPMQAYDAVKVAWTEAGGQIDLERLVKAASDRLRQRKPLHSLDPHDSGDDGW